MKRYNEVILFWVSVPVTFLLFLLEQGVNSLSIKFSWLTSKKSHNLPASLLRDIDWLVVCCNFIDKTHKVQSHENFIISLSHFEGIHLLLKTRKNRRKKKLFYTNTHSIKIKIVLQQLFTYKNFIRRRTLSPMMTTKTNRYERNHLY